MKQKHAVQAKVLLDAAFLRKVDLFKGLPDARLQTMEAALEQIEDETSETESLISTLLGAITLTGL